MEQQYNQQYTASKYVQSINVMSNVTGILEAVRLNCNANNDKASVYLIEKSIKEINKCLGIETHLIDLSCFNVQKKEIQPQPQKEVKNINIAHAVENLTKPEIATAVLRVENTKQEQKQQAKPDEYGVIENKEENTLEYVFKNSTSLENMKYFRDTKELQMTFLRNGRTYLYKKVKKEVFETLYLLDNRNAHAGRYFQQNIVSVWKKGQYQEMYNVKIGINGKEYSFNSDLSEGVENACKKIFSETKYAYNCFNAMYGRGSKQDL